MSTIRRWALWRRIFYGSGFFVIIGLITALVYWHYFYVPGNCFDAVRSGTERGVDCGGECVRMCVTDIVPPIVLWVDSFKIAEGQYNAVAYVENKNQAAGSPLVSYTFEFFSGTTKIGERTGTTVLPPNSVYPIFEGRVFTNAESITDTTITLSPIELWLPALVGREQFRTSNLNLVGADEEPRLRVTIENTELIPVKDVEVVATLFNDRDEPVTASQTFIESLSGRQSREVVFTWPSPITKTVRSCVIPTDVVLGIDLSGSMNNDGGTPPQPISDTLVAAKNFIGRLGEKDQSAIVTFATEVRTERTLNKNHTDTATLVSSLVIDPIEEVGYTNTPAALTAAASELDSERHNRDARRVLVLLTDGLPTGRGQSNELLEETKNTAKNIAESGVSIYVIGLGSNVDEAFVSALASDPAHAFYAPTAADLERIYSTISTALCESGATRIDVIAKTPTNFAPLR